MAGTVNISRDLWEDEAFAKEAFSEREAWIWMIAEASWKERKRRVKGHVVDLGRGQLAVSVRFMAKACGWTSAKVQRFLKRLQKMDMIRVSTDTGVSVISICNYEKYQSSGKASDTATIQERYSTDTNEKKGERRGKEGERERAPRGASRSRGSRLPDDWQLPKDWGDWAVSEGFSEFEVRREAEKFRDYWHSVAGQKGTKADWQATWRNWIRRALEDRSKRPNAQNGRAPSRDQQIARFKKMGRAHERSDDGVTSISGAGVS